MTTGDLFCNHVRECTLPPSLEPLPIEESEDIITVNLTSAIICIQKLLTNLKQSDNAKIILIGSTSGLENSGSQAVAYAASKFGLRGLGHALRENLRKDSITVTCINPGEVERRESVKSPVQRRLRAPMSSVAGALRSSTVQQCAIPDT